jgi:hypothetical protein
MAIAGVPMVTVRASTIGASKSRVWTMVEKALATAACVTCVSPRSDQRQLVWGRSGHIDCFGDGNGVPGGHALSYSGICYGAVLLALEPDEPQGFCAGVVPRRDCEHQRQDWPHRLLWRQQRRTRGPCAGHILIRYGAVLLDPEPDEPQGFCTSVVPVVGARGSAQALCLRLVLKARACLRLCTRLRRSCG